ncbi:DNA glycosylase [Lepidopterella palustris CBS 459.81]|uniref:Endonuclease III homolog n=1 Tax=Lepidopterella palustris CBS 459.81 TaxID=1314670 RepID=A0A8E2EJI7_9PEZI|nr:DNA glycosylase [Lepidopterella palustris CBS 459.81]
MRTSRISRDTAKVLAASRSRPIRSTQTRALHVYALASGNAPSAKDVAVENEEGMEVKKERLDSASESELSDVPEDGEEVDGGRAASRKRKRGMDTPVVGSVKREDVTTTNGSSRKRKVAVEELKDAFVNGMPKKARRAPAKKTVKADGSIKVEPPSNWEEIYALTRQMRAAHIAPVDTMGCESLADTTQSPRDQRFQTLVALMLSSQTKDTVTSVAIKNLQDNLPGGFNLESILAVEPTVLNGFIAKVGFHNLKTKYIKAAAEILKTSFNSDIPDTIDGLTSLPGVGPKMAYLCMSAAWGRDEGIGVDVHVHRITNLWGWHKTKAPEETRTALQSWLPKDRWHDINNLLVGFGQTICLPVGRRCGECKLSERGLCPSAVVEKVRAVKKEKVVVKEEEPDGSAVAKGEVETVEKHDVKIEDVEDIEDIGKPSSRRLRRLIP